MEDLLLRSFLEVGKLYRKKEISPVEVIEKIFERIKQTEPQLNAFITVLEDRALHHARKAEKLFLKNEQTHLLTGIPYSVKDLYYTEGVLTTCGSNVLKDFTPDFTANVIKKLEDKGAILFGKTNMLEFAYGIVHPDFGQTNNPWNVSRTSGGSSGGSAASVAAGIGFFSLGTDTGGSIRIPASYCGVAGLKPTKGIVSTHGVFPLSWSLDHAGPIARSSKEIAVVMDVMSLDNQELLTDKYLDRYDVSETTKRVGVLPEIFLKDVNPEVKQVYDRTISKIRGIGWEMYEVSVEQWERAEEMIMDILLPEAAHIHKKWLGLKNDYAEMTYKQIELGMVQKAVTYLDGLDSLHRFTSAISSLFDRIDVLLTPTVAFPAPEEDPALGSEELNEMVFTGPFNISGHPAVSINMGFTEGGLPIGMQLVGPLFQDMELLKTAHVLECTCPAVN